MTIDNFLRTKFNKHGYFLLVPPLDHLRPPKILRRVKGYKTKHKLHLELTWEDNTVTELNLSDIYQFKIGSLKPRTRFTRKFLYQRGRRNKVESHD